MRIIHLGPPMKRGGGPAGYLLELSRAASAECRAETGHQVSFPELAPSNGSAAARPSSLSIRERFFPMLRRARRWRRRFLGPPRQYRPSLEELNRPDGPVSRLIAESKASILHKNRASLEPAIAALSAASRSPSSPHVLFAHDSVTAEALLERESGARVWLMQHSPMPFGLYLAWNWGTPEATWEEVARYPDVLRSIEWELSVCRRVDRLVLPCPEALDELARVEPRFGELRPRCDFLLSGVSAVGLGSELSMEAARARFGLPRNERLALFLGNAQAYRGLDVLLESLAHLPGSVPGRLVVAGPSEDSFATHTRLVALGRVEAVGDLLAAVDFVVSTNRFSLFDLSLIEALGAGKPLVLHEVGGNRALAGLGAGCRSFDSLEPRRVASELTEMFRAEASLVGSLARRSRDCYRRHLTAESMWRRHLALYDRAAGERKAS